MYSSSRKVEYNTDIILGRIVIVSKSYRVQRNKGAKCFVIADASTAFSLIIFVFVVLCTYLKCFWTISFMVRFKAFLRLFSFDLLELPEASRSGWN
jgi:hypothetical protein